MNRRTILVVAAAAILVAAGCNSTSSTPSCTAVQTLCDDVCVDTNTDAQHCGACDTPCATGLGCVDGVCQLVCPTGLIACSDACVDPLTDRAFCGASGDCTGANDGTVCAAGEICVAGACATSCPGSEIVCGDACVDPLTDRAFCGASGDCTGTDAGIACADGEVCVDGACATSCPGTQIVCDGACIEPLTDRAFCGASGDCTGTDAGIACADGEVCVDGACATSCPGTQIVCDGACIEPQTDRAFCGASGDCTGTDAGTACADGEVCVDGACSVSCPGTQIVCDGACIEPQTDRAFCGASGDCTGTDAGTACADGEVCVDGGCSVSCPGTQIVCDGACIEPQTDRAFCGASGDCTGTDAGTACADGELCIDGACVVSCPGTQIVCDGACIDPLTSNAYCGATGDCLGTNAGTVCAWGATCYAGSCCTAAQVGCDGSCIDPLTDYTHCGATSDCLGANAGVLCDPGDVCDAGTCRSALVNGSFETGDFTGWVATDLADPYWYLHVGVTGDSNGFFPATPTDGTHAAMNGFDGCGPGTISVGQDVELHGTTLSLLFDYRAGYNVVGGSAIARTFTVTVEPAGGGTPLQTTTVLTATGYNADTGPLSGNIDLSAYNGQNVFLRFSWYVPECYSGPAEAQLDDVRLTGSW